MLGTCCAHAWYVVILSVLLIVGHERQSSDAAGEWARRRYGRVGAPATVLKSCPYETG